MEAELYMSMYATPHLPLALAVHLVEPHLLRFWFLHGQISLQEKDGVEEYKFFPVQILMLDQVSLIHCSVDTDTITRLYNSVWKFVLYYEIND